MSRKGPVRVSRSNRDSFLFPLIISIVIIAVISAILAFIWQKNQESKQGLEPFRVNESSLSPGGSSSGSSELVPGSSSEPSSQEEPSSSQSSSEPSSSEGQDLPSGQPVPETERVTSSYFDDAMFVGDSITTGIELYDVMPGSDVVAFTGINLDNILTREVINTPNGKVTMLDAMKNYNPKKIYIMLGANGLAFLTEEQTRDYYSVFVDRVMEQHPDAMIYIQSILPIQEEKFAANYQGTLTNEKIDRTNQLLMEMAAEKGIYYLNVAEAFKDETGQMPDAASTDGLHFTSEYYIKWMDYLKTHAIKEEE